MPVPTLLFTTFPRGLVQRNLCDRSRNFGLLFHAILPRRALAKIPIR